MKVPPAFALCLSLAILSPAIVQGQGTPSKPGDSSQEKAKWPEGSLSSAAVTSQGLCHPSAHPEAEYLIPALQVETLAAKQDWNAIGQIWSKLKKRGRATGTFESLFERVKTTWLARVRYRRARATVDAVLKTQPQNAAAHEILGGLYVLLAWKSRGGGWARGVSKSGWDGFRANLKLARESFLKACALAKQDPVPWAEMIDLHFLAHEPKKAKACLLKALELDPKCMPALINFHHYLAPKWYGSWESYWDFAKKAKQLCPQEPGVSLLLLSSAVEQLQRKVPLSSEQRALAEQAFHGVAKAYPRYPSAWVYRAQFLALSGGKPGHRDREVIGASRGGSPKLLGYWAARLSSRAKTPAQQKRALATFCRAAHLGNASCMADLGFHFYGGTLGLKRNKAFGLDWYRRAAVYKRARALYWMGYCYHFGFQVARNRSTSQSYFLAALRYGLERRSKKEFRRALLYLGDTYHWGHDGAERDQRRAIQAWELAAQRGQPQAMRRLGGYYLVQRRRKPAIHWLTKALANGIKAAGPLLQRARALPPEQPAEEKQPGKF